MRMLMKPVDFSHETMRQSFKKVTKSNEKGHKNNLAKILTLQLQ
jgi:hypothetical protein